MDLYLPPTIKEEEDTNISSSFEKMTDSMFFRKHATYLPGQLNNKPKLLEMDFELPFGSCLHLFDTLYDLERKLPVRDFPNLNIPVLTNEKVKKFIYHVRQPDTKGVINVEDKYLFVSRGLNKLINEHQIKNMKTFKPLNDINQISTTSKNTLTVVNHNILNRVKIRGTLTTHRKFSVILSSIINTICKIPNKKHYVFLPLGSKIYTKDKFLQSKKKLDMVSIKDKDNYHYLLMMHWVNFVDTTTDMSLFESIPEHLRYDIIFVFQAGDKYLMYNLADIKKLNDKNKTYIRFVNQFNTLTLSGMGLELPVTKDTAHNDIEELQQDIETEKIIEDVYKGTTSTNKEKKAEIEQEYSTALSDGITSSDIQYTDEENIEEVEEDSISELDRILDEGDNLDDDILQDDSDQIVTPIVEEDEGIVETGKVSSQAPTNTLGTLSEFTLSVNSDSANNITKDYLASIDDSVLDYINNTPNLTTKERERILNLSNLYKDIEIGDVSIMDILINKDDPTIESKTVDSLKDYVLDESMLKSSITNFDSQYMNKAYLKDLVQNALSLNKQGLFLTGIEQEFRFTASDKLIDYKFSYVDIKGKKHNVKFTMPFIDEDGTCLINGNKSYLKKQMVVLPICKVSETRVSLTSNYNKTIVERNTTKAHSFVNYFRRLLSKIEEIYPVTYEYQSRIFNDRLPYEYTEIAKMYKLFHFVTPEKKNIYLHFDRSLNEERFAKHKSSSKFNLDVLERKYGVFFGNYITNEKHLLMFINLSNIITLVNLDDINNTENTSLLNMFSGIYSIKLSSSLTEWSEIKMLDKNLPTGFLICYKHGFRSTLDYLGVKYTKVNKKLKLGSESLVPALEKVETRYKPKFDDIVIKFKDCNYYIPRYPLRNSLIMAGMTNFDTSSYLVEELDTKDVYYQLLAQKKLSMNYLKGIDDHFNMFVDPITFDVLKQMNEPTNFRDLIIRATDMLTTSKFNHSSSMNNHRIRTFEKMNAIVYTEISRAFANYTRQGNKNPFSINPQAILLKIQQDQAMMLVDEINPVHDVKTISGITYTGAGGRTSAAFTETDRLVTDDAIGILSESTPDSGAVGIVAQASIDPSIVNTRGMIDTSKPLDELDPANVLSVSAMLMPGTTQDDC